MKVVFWLMVFLIAYSYFGYPIILIILGLRKEKKVSKREIIPTVTLLIPVYNEERIIREKIENSLDLDYPCNKLEIVVASESTDRTNEIVREYADRGIVLYSFKKREGKQATIYQSLPLAKGDIIVFSDVNGMYRKDALKKIMRNFADTRVGCVVGQLRYINPKEAPIGESESLYWKYENILKKLESKIGSVLGANGPIYAIRKSLYKPLSKYRGDDFELPIRIALQGYLVIWEPEALSTEETRQASIEEFKRKIRIVAWVWKSALILLKESFKSFKYLLVFEIISHRILRYLVPVFLTGILIGNIFLLKYPFYRIIFAIQNIFYLMAILGYAQERKEKKVNKVFNISYYFCLVNLAAFIALTKAITGKQKCIWEKIRREI